MKTPERKLYNSICPKLEVAQNPDQLTMYKKSGVIIPTQESENMQVKQ